LDACGARGGTAIYTLADPREVRSPRYVGQTRDPHARFAQHVRTARLWLPDEIPWWVRSPKHRPLYAWIRELNRDGGRLPFMWVEEWIEPDADPLVADEGMDAGMDARGRATQEQLPRARGRATQGAVAERAAIMRWLARGAALLNAEALKLGAQLPLL
jgi:hypothetical protein